MKIAFSKDIHKLYKNKYRKLILGGIEIDNTKWKIKAHSDGDLIIHSIVSSLLSLLDEKTLGEWYPENEQNKNLDSSKMLITILEKIKQRRIKLLCIDICLICELIMLKDYLKTIKQHLLSFFKDYREISLNLKVTRFEKKHYKYIECYCNILSD